MFILTKSKIISPHIILFWLLNQMRGKDAFVVKASAGSLSLRTGKISNAPWIRIIQRD